MQTLIIAVKEAEASQPVWYLTEELKIGMTLRGRENKPERAKLHKQISGEGTIYVEYVGGTEIGLLGQKPVTNMKQQ